MEQKVLDNYKLRLVRLMENPFGYIEDDDFLDPAKEKEITGPMPDHRAFAKAREEIRSRLDEVDPEMRVFYMEPLLTREQERHLFRQFNFYKYKAYKLLQGCNPLHPVPVFVEQIEAYLKKAREIKTQIAASNSRLVMSIAKKQADFVKTSSVDLLMEIVSDGNLGMLRAIDYFNYKLGNKFSTYATWAILDTIKRSRLQRMKHINTLTGVDEGILDCCDRTSVEEDHGTDLPPLDLLMEDLTPRQKEILVKYYGLDGNGSRRLDEIGKSIGISKERVRQLRESGLSKLREKLGVPPLEPLALAKGA